MSETRNVLVLGADGFLGSHAVDALAARGHLITAFDRFPYRRTRNLGRHIGAIRFVAGEYANRDHLAEALRGQDAVFHFICATNPAASWNDPLVEVEQNLVPLLHFLDAAAEAGIRKIVFPSSGGTVYGRRDEPCAESAVPAPFSPYGIAKLAAEHLLHHYRERAGLAVDVYRISNAYGPRQPMERGQGVIAIWIDRILRGEEIQVYGDETTLRDYVHVRDVARLMSHSLEDPGASGLFNLGSGSGTSVAELLRIFQRVVDVPFRFRQHPRRPSDNAALILDSHRLLERFPGFDFEDLERGIAEMWQGCKAQAASAEPRWQSI
jgi:UDP-glucose 4-epimerase